MARAVYSHELIDQDFAWLVANFQEDNPHYFMVEPTGLPLLFLERSEVKPPAMLPHLSGDEQEVGAPASE